MNNKSKVCVVGSINMDLVTSTEQMPEQGETLLGDDFFTTPGGKGANQAVAASRIGAEVTMIGAVGDDDFGERTLENLKNNQVNTSGITKVSNAPTGIANIILSEKDNRIIVVQGANGHLSQTFIKRNENIIKESDIVLLQLEIPEEAIVEAVDIAFEHGVAVILNPAPYRDIPKDTMDKISFLTPNEGELRLMKASHDAEHDLPDLIVTLGENGAEIIAEHDRISVEGYQVDVSDTTGAGDTFNGVLAAMIAQGNPLNDSVKIANAAAALSVTKMGAQQGMPGYEDAINFLKESEEKQ